MSNSLLQIRDSYIRDGFFEIPQETKAQASKRLEAIGLRDPLDRAIFDCVQEIVHKKIKRPCLDRLKFGCVPTLRRPRSPITVDNLIERTAHCFKSIELPASMELLVGTKAFNRRLQKIPDEVDPIAILENTLSSLTSRRQAIRILDRVEERLEGRDLLGLVKETLNDERFTEEITAEEIFNRFKVDLKAAELLERERIDQKLFNELKDDLIAERILAEESFDELEDDLICESQIDSEITKKLVDEMLDKLLVDMIGDLVPVLDSLAMKKGSS